MAADNFARALALVLKIEGGYVDHPADPGGATNHGITLTVLSACRGHQCTKADVAALTVDEAGEIYWARYWNKVSGDELPAGIDYAVFDFAVNSGVDRASKALQRAVKVPADGDIGPGTLAAVAKADPRAVINAICDERLAFLKRIKTWRIFGRGWERRVDDVRAAALAMVIDQSRPSWLASLFNPRG